MQSPGRPEASRCPFSVKSKADVVCKSAFSIGAEKIILPFFCFLPVSTMLFTELGVSL